MNNRTLIISTSFSTQVLGLVREDSPIDEMLIDTRNNHLETAVMNLERLLSRNSLDARDIGRVVVDVGPGSFTGIRIGVSVARAFCQSTGVMAIAVSSFDALAQGVPVADAGAKKLIVVLKEARKSRVYAAFFRRSGEDHGLDRIGTEHDIGIADLLVLQEFLDAAGEGNVVFTGDAVLPNEPYIRENFRAPAEFRSCLFPSAGDYAALAGSGRYPAVSWERLIPHYIRQSDAEIVRVHG